MMQLKMNIIIMGVNGFIGNFGHYKSNLEHSMRGSDDATIFAANFSNKQTNK